MEADGCDVCVCFRKAGCDCGWWREEEFSDLCCGLHMLQEFGVLFAWRRLETCCLPRVQGKRTEPRPEREEETDDKKQTQFSMFKT